MASDLPTRNAAPTLIRAVGPLSLTAIAVNGMVGAGIFALPANVAQLLGLASPLAYLVGGIAVLLIAFCFAEAGSLFDGSGGPYLYARAAFGPFVGFQAGWMFVLTRLTAVAAISNTFASYLGYFWPAVPQGIGRLLTVTLVIAILTTINCLGIRPGVWTINVLTVGKLLPLLVFCLVGLFALDSRGFSFTALPPLRSLQQASLLLIFALGGFETASVPSEEVIRPRHTLPWALVGSVSGVVLLYLCIQIVAMGTLPELATSPAPLAAAASRFLGPVGGILLTIGAIFSTTGTNSSSIFVGSRMLYALAQGGGLPPVLGRIHPRYRTPVASLVLFAVVAWGLAISGTFTELVAVSALARLVLYTATCVAIPVLRRKMPAAERQFTIPGGGLLPLLAAAVCVWLLIGSSLSQAAMLAAALVVGALLYVFGRRAISAPS